jgi:tetratricopeptide (TPR) repeat protein
MRATTLALLALVLSLPVFAGEEDVKSLYEAGRKAEAAGDFKTAFEKYDRVMDLDEEYEDVFERWEACERLAEWQGGLEGEPKAMDYVRLGEIYMELERFEAECEAYRKALRLDPECADAHGHLALAHYTNLSNGGDLVVVVEETMKLLETSPHRDRLEQARADFEVYGRLRIMRQALSEVLSEAGQAARKRDYAKAAGILEEATAGEMPDAYRTKLWTEAGKFRLRAGDREGARKAFLAATGHAPSSATSEACLGLASIAVGEGKLEEAIEHLKGAVAEGSDACKMIERQKAKAFKALFTAGDEAIRGAAESLCDPKVWDEPLREKIRAACKQAAEAGKKVLLLWYGPYCPYVMAMEERLAHPEVREALDAGFVFLQVDVGSHHRWDTVDREYTVDDEYESFTDCFGVPSFLVLSADGTIHAWKADTELMGADHRCYDVPKIVKWLKQASED